MGTGIDLMKEFEALHNGQDMAGVADVFTVDGVYSGPAGKFEGPDAIRAYHVEAEKRSADSRLDIFLVLEQGDTVMAEWTYTFTMTSSGETVEIAGASVAKITEGKFASLRDYYDRAPVLRQMGFMPAG